MKKLRFLITIIAGLWCCVMTNAYDFTVSGVYYQITSSSTVSVTYRSYNDNDESDFYDTYYTSWGDVVIPETVTYNGNTYTVTAIGNNAFHDGYIKSVVIPNTVKTIGQSAFEDVEALERITIPNSVTSIGRYAFRGCKDLRYPTIEAKLTTFPDRIFDGCTNLKEIVLPKTLTSIGWRAFYDCTSLSWIYSESVESPSLGANVFDNVPKSCILRYPEGSFDSYDSWSKYLTLEKFRVDGIYYNVLSIDDKTVEVTFRGDAYNSYVDEYTGDIVIPETVSYGGTTFTMTAIGLSAFSGCENVTSVTLPSTIKEIGEYGFNYCTKLASLNLPEGLTTIGPRALRICHSLTDVEIPTSVKTIGESAFYECKKMESITFRGPIASIGSSAFDKCDNLMKVHVDDIADWCQMGFSNLKSHPIAVNPIYGDYGNTIGSKGALYVDGEMVTALVIPDDVEKINDMAFINCEKITSVDFGSGVKVIGKEAFAGCCGLQSLSIPSNITLIEDFAFNYCQEISQITFEDASESIVLGCGGLNDYGVISYGLFSTCRLSKPLYIGRNLNYNYTENVGPFDLVNGYYEEIGTVTFGGLVTEIPSYLLYNSGIYVDNICFRSNPTVGIHAFAPTQEIHLVLEDTNNADFNAENKNTFASAEYYRELGEGKFGTIMLPFAPKTDKYVFFKLTAASDNMLTFDEEVDPKANTPYLYKLRENAENGAIIANGSITIMADINNSELNDWQMVGSFSNRTIATENSSDCYFYDYIPEDNQLHRATKELHTKPYRAYFISDNNQTTQIAVRTNSGDITIIDATEVEGLTPAVYYDLSGRSIDNPQKGIYIVNGKKVIL